MPSYLAGSAIAQGPNVGRIDRWSQWKPTSIEPKWLLLSGATDPPRDIDISDRRTRDIPGIRSGTFLSGVTHDLANMEGAVGANLFNTVKDLYLTKSRASDHIIKLFRTCKLEGAKPMLYYTGHGEIGTGNWCFANGTISIQEILDMRPKETYFPMIFSDACYSGHWANFCVQKNISGFHCLAACPEYSVALDSSSGGGEYDSDEDHIDEDVSGEDDSDEDDSDEDVSGEDVSDEDDSDEDDGDEDDSDEDDSDEDDNDEDDSDEYDEDEEGKGGDLTLFMTGKKLRPGTEPMYSGGSIRDFPITRGYHKKVNYKHLIKSQIQNSKNILISQSMHTGFFCGCFAPSKRYSPRPEVAWGNSGNHDSFLKLVDENEKSKNIYSLACDDNFGFGVFFMANYGTNQTIVTKITDIQEKYDKGFRITACAARDLTIYVVMKKGTMEYKTKKQIWFTHEEWKRANDEIQEFKKKGKVITGICYSTGLKKYFVVMTAIPGCQTYKWFRDAAAAYNWMDELDLVGYHPTIIFKDPTDNETLVVMTTDKYRSSYSCKFDLKLK